MDQSLLRSLSKIKFPVHPPFCEGRALSAAGPDANPIGLLRPSETAIRFGTGFMDFRSPEPLGIGGLVKVKPGTCDILAVLREQPGQGHFSRFLDALERQYPVITFWSMMSDDLTAILKRRGYSQVKLTDPFGKRHKCMRFGTPLEIHDATVHPGDGDGGQGTVPQGAGEGVGVGGV